MEKHNMQKLPKSKQIRKKYQYKKIQKTSHFDKTWKKNTEQIQTNLPMNFTIDEYKRLDTQGKELYWKWRKKALDEDYQILTYQKYLKDSLKERGKIILKLHKPPSELQTYSQAVLKTREQRKKWRRKRK
jgi:hypothetical protein